MILHSILSTKLKVTKVTLDPLLLSAYFDPFEGRQIKTNHDSKSQNPLSSATSSKPSTVQTTPTKSLADTRDVGRQQLSLNDDASLWDTYLNEQSDTSTPSTPLSKLVPKTSSKLHKSSPATSSKQSMDKIIGSNEKKDGIKRSDHKAHPQRSTPSHSRRRMKSGDDESKHKRNVSDTSLDSVDINHVQAKVKPELAVDVVDNQQDSITQKADNLQSHQDHIDASLSSNSSHQLNHDQDKLSQVATNNSDHIQPLELDDQIRQTEDKDTPAVLASTDADEVKEGHVVTEMPSPPIQQDEECSMNNDDINLRAKSDSPTQITDDSPVEVEPNSEIIVQQQDIQMHSTPDGQEIDNHNESSGDTDDVPVNQIVQEMQTGSKTSTYSTNECKTDHTDTNLVRH